MVERVIATASARALMDRLLREHGALALHHAGDGAPRCLPRHALAPGAEDLLLGEFGGCPVYVSARQREHWQRNQLLLDAAPGEPPSFRVRSHLFSTEEWAALMTASGRPAAP